MSRLKLKKTPARNAAEESQRIAEIAEAVREPTLVELRDKYELGTLKRVEIEAREYSRLTEIAKEHGNAANRQKTLIKNAVKAVARQEDMKPEDAVLVDGEEYRFDVTTSDKINIDKFWKLYEDGDITVEQLKQVVSINKGEAERVIGAHVINSITDTVKGKTADIRTSESREPSFKGVKLVRYQPKPTEVEVTPERPVVGDKVKRAGKVALKRKLRL